MREGKRKREEGWSFIEVGYGQTCMRSARRQCLVASVNWNGIVKEKGVHARALAFHVQALLLCLLVWPCVSILKPVAAFRLNRPLQERMDAA